MMRRPSIAEDRAEIEALLRKLNRAWLAGDGEGLAELIHEDAVIVRPGFEGQSVGRFAWVASYLDFMAAATIHSFEEDRFVIDVWGDTAVANYEFVLSYEVAGAERTDRGRDLFALNRERDGWVVVWRTLVT